MLTIPILFLQVLSGQYLFLPFIACLPCFHNYPPIGYSAQYISVMTPFTCLKPFIHSFIFSANIYLLPIFLIC